MKQNKKHDRLIKRAETIKLMISDLYEELGTIEDTLIEEKFKGNERALMIDNFKTKNTVFRTTSVRRFELKFR